MTNPTTSELYDVAAPTWVRTEPVLLSDYTARPFVLDAAAPLEGRRILDLGCGEGYVSRQLAAHAPARLLSLDISSGNIRFVFLVVGGGNRAALDHNPPALFIPVETVNRGAHGHQGNRPAGNNKLDPDHALRGDAEINELLVSVRASQADPDGIAAQGLRLEGNLQYIALRIGEGGVILAIDRGADQQGLSRVRPGPRGKSPIAGKVAVISRLHLP